MSLKSYCEENDRLRLLREWDAESNLPLTPETVAHTQHDPRVVEMREGTHMVYAGAQPLKELHRLPALP